MGKYTKGPWTTEKDQIDCNINIHGDEVWIATIHGDHYTKGSRCINGFPSNDERDANANLIASAPDLLLACKQAQKILQDKYHTGCLELDHAIAKAEHGT